jgi:hypothetical protein
MLVILATQEAEIRRIEVQHQPSKISWKHPTENRASGVVQVVEHLPSEPVALSSNPSGEGVCEIIKQLLPARHSAGVHEGHKDTCNHSL